MTTLTAYLEELRQVLRAALCLHQFPSQKVERHNKPCIETEDHSTSELVLPPQKVKRSVQEEALVEQSFNSTRVSLRFFKPADSQEAYILHTFLRFFLHRADVLEFSIARRVPLPTYDVTFLITNFHLERYHREGLINFICKFVEDLHGTCSAMKLSLWSRARAVAAQYWQQLEQHRHAAAAAAHET